MRIVTAPFLGIILLTLSAASFAAKPQTEILNGREVSAQEILLKFFVPNPRAVARLQHELDADSIRPVGAPGGPYLVHSRSKHVAAMLQALSRHNDVIYAEPNYIVHAAAVPNDPSFGQLWGLRNTGQTVSGAAGTPGADIRATSAWDVSTGSTNTVLAELDSGVDYTHPDLAANIWSAPAAFSVNIGGVLLNCAAGTHGFNVLTNTCDPMDDNGHGTHVAGIIGALGNNGVGVTGVNWTARIMAVKFVDSTFTGTIANAINAVEFAIQANAALGGAANIRVLNVSWGSAGFSQAFLDEINRANTNNMLLVAAAGNNNVNNDATPYYPSSYTAPNVVAVAATDSNDNRTSWSDYGPATVHLGAPGQNIYSTLLGGGYMFLNGTSMSTAYVSGSALLVLSKCSLDTAGLKSDLLNTVDPLASLAGITVTGGRLNVDKAIRACSSGFTMTASPNSRVITAGSAASYTVTVAAVNGFTGSVSLSAGGLPAGAGAAFSPAVLSGSGSSTLTISTPASATSGPYYVTVTGTSGALSDSVPVDLLLDAGSPTLVSVSPSSGSGLGQTFSFVVSDPDGYRDVSAMNILFNSSFSGTNACWLYYSQSGNLLALASNDTSVWNEVVLGSAGTLQNSQCSIDAATGSVTGAGNSLTLTITVTFSSTFAGTRSIYMRAVDNAGFDSGYQAKGSWTVGAGGTPDFTISAAPASQTVAVGSSATYTVSVSAVNGFTGAVSLGAGGLPSGASATFSPGSINGSGSSTLTVNTSASTPPGSYTVTVTGLSGALSHSGSVALGVTSGGPPAVSVTPSSGSGMSQVFSVLVSDSGGYANLTGVDVLFNSSFTGTNGCWLYYDQSSNTLWMASNDTSTWNNVAVGSAGTLQNSQCSVSGTGVSAAGSGNNLTLSLSISFTSTFAGTQTTYLRATDNSGQDSGYQAKGTWTVP